VDITWLPGLRLVHTYRREWLPKDVLAGLSLAAVALPIGIAYAPLVGLPPVVGIYSCIFPLVAYALFGSSRQLIVNPDAAACAIVAATLAPMAISDPAHYADLSIALALLTGLLCIAGGLAGLGVIANFLSRPILTGYLNGIALSIISGQLAKLLGFKVASAGFFRTLFEVVSRLGETHLPTLAVGLALFVLLQAFKRLAPRVPAPLVAVVLGIGAVYVLGLDRQGVAVVGPVPAGFPTPRIPAIQTGELWPLAFGACGIVLVTFCSMMTTARGFAAKNGYTIDTSRDMIALGACDLASGLTRGFVVSGAASRTAVAESAGGKSQVTALAAAATMAAVLVFLTAPLTYLPSAALAAILISAVLGLFDIASLRGYYRVSRPEFRHAMVAMLGVMTVGVLPGILVAVARHPAAPASGVSPAGRRPRPGRGKGRRLRHGRRGREDDSGLADLSLRRLAGVLQRRLLQGSRARAQQRRRHAAAVVAVRRRVHSLHGHHRGRSRGSAPRRARGTRNGAGDRTRQGIVPRHARADRRCRKNRDGVFLPHRPCRSAGLPGNPGRRRSYDDSPIVSRRRSSLP